MAVVVDGHAAHIGNIPDECHQLETAVVTIAEFCLEYSTHGASAPSSMHQNMLLSMTAHEDILLVLRLPYDVRLKAVFCACHFMLQSLIKENANAQRVLADHLEFFLDQLPLHVGAANTIRAIYENNRDLLLSIKPAFLDDIIEYVGPLSAEALDCMGLLKTLIYVNAQPQPHNQIMILKVKGGMGGCWCGCINM